MKKKSCGSRGSHLNRYIHLWEEADSDDDIDGYGHDDIDDGEDRGDDQD